MKFFKKLTNGFKVLSILLLAIGYFGSCSDDKSDIPAQTQKMIKLSTTHVSLYDEEGEVSKTVQIEGEGQYFVQSEDENIATASIANKTIIISMGNKSGATTIIVSSAQGEKGEIVVNCGIYNLTFDRYTLNMKPGEKAQVKILSGNFTYAGEDLTVEAVNEDGDNSEHFEIDKNILWQDPKRTTMTIKALKAGKTTIRITDQKGKSADIALEVLDIQLNNLTVSKTNLNIYGIGNDIVEVTNGNGEYAYKFTKLGIVELENLSIAAKPIYLLKAQKIGETELIITDKLTEQTKSIKISVKNYSNLAALLPSNKWLAIDFKKYAELYPNKVDNWAQIPELTWEIEAKINAGNSATLLGIEGQFLARTPYCASNRYISICVGDHPNVYSEYELDKNKYYKFTFVVSFKNKTTDIYIDGVKQAIKIDGSNDYSRGGLNLTLPNSQEDNLFAIGRASGGRYLNGGIKYMRMWTRCLTEKEVIDDAKKLYVDPSSPGLLGEWVFEGDASATEFRSLNQPYFVATVKGGTIDEYE